MPQLFLFTVAGQNVNYYHKNKGLVKTEKFIGRRGIGTHRETISSSQLMRVRDMKERLKCTI